MAEVKMDGWWHPVKLTVTFSVKNMFQAEKIIQLLQETNDMKEAKQVETHLRDQIEFKCGNANFYNHPDIPAGQ